jgi:hypothetical protein
VGRCSSVEWAIKAGNGGRVAAARGIVDQYPVRRYLHKIRPARGRGYQEVLYEPAEAMQVDWGDCGRLTIGQTPRRVSVFVAVLCYSRMCYIEFSLSQRKADFYRALVHALARVAASIAAMMPRDGGGPSLCIIRRRRRRCGARCIVYVVITSANPCQLRVFYGVPSRATLQDQPAAATCQALTTAHNRPEIAALSKPGASAARMRIPMV